VTAWTAHTADVLSCGLLLEWHQPRGLLLTAGGATDRVRVWDVRAERIEQEWTVSGLLAKRHLSCFVSDPAASACARSLPGPGGQPANGTLSILRTMQGTSLTQRHQRLPATPPTQSPASSLSKQEALALQVKRLGAPPRSPRLAAQRRAAAPAVSAPPRPPCLRPPRPPRRCSLS
jgi:hypothetical protein